MEQRVFDEMIAAMRDWELSRTLVKGESVFPSAEPSTASQSTFPAFEVETSEFLPLGMDYFVIPNSRKVIMSPAFWERVREFIDDWAGASNLVTVA